MPHPDRHPEFLSGYCRSATAVANDLILVELDGRQHSLFYSPLSLGLNFNQVLGGVS